MTTTSRTTTSATTAATTVPATWSRRVTRAAGARTVPALAGVVLVGVLPLVGGCTRSTPAPVTSTGNAPSVPADVSGSVAGAGVSSSGTPTPATTAAPATAANPVGSGRGGSPRGQGRAIAAGAAADPSEVAAVVAQAVFVWDTTLDRSPQDAARRAGAWMTPALAARQDVGTGGAGVAWSQLAAARGYTTAATAADTEPPPVLPAGQAVRRVFVTVTAHPGTPAAAGGSVVWRQTWTVLVSLQRLPAGWRVAQLVEQPGGAR